MANPSLLKGSSFSHAFSGGSTSSSKARPETFGGDNFGVNHYKGLSIPPSKVRGNSFEHGIEREAVWSLSVLTVADCDKLPCTFPGRAVFLFASFIELHPNDATRFRYAPIV
jgi:hypothetical protein